MILHATRDHFTRTTTLSRLAIEYNALAYGQLPGSGNAPVWHADNPRGPLPLGYVCEDEDRGLDQQDPAGCAALKVRAETAIPVGLYRLRRTLSTRFADRCPDGKMMEVCDVPAFRGIRLHPGATEKHTEGCLLPGTHRDLRRGMATGSTAMWAWLDARVQECEARGEAVWLHVARDAAAWAGFLSAGGADGRAA